MMQQHEKFVRMTTYPVERLMLRLAVPTITTMLITAFYNMADTFFVGQLHNTSATGAVGVVFSFMAIIQAVGFFFGQGSGNAISRLLGQERTEEAQRIATIGFFSALMVGGIIMVLGLLFLTPLARLLGSTETILPYAEDYLRVILLGAPYMTSSLVLNNQLRFQGNAFYGMLGIGTGAVLNVVLDPLFIFGLNMGVTGAALATAISQFVGFCILLFCCTRGDNLRIRPRLFRPRFNDYRVIVRGGLPTLCRQGLSSGSTIALNFMAGVFGGDAAIAAMSVATRVMQLAFSAVIGFGQGFQPVCGFNFGAGLYSRVKCAFRFCARCSTGILTVAAIGGFVFAPQLIALFSDDPAVIPIGTVSLRLQCLGLPFMGFYTSGNMMLQTVGCVGRASFLSMARQGIFFIPLVLFLPWLFSVLAVSPLLGVQLAQPLADILSFVVSVPMTLSLLRAFPKDACD